MFPFVPAEEHLEVNRSRGGTVTNAHATRRDDYTGSAISCNRTVPEKVDRSWRG
jgi:hypothetical protein